jgi:hypothetical protein
MPQHSRRIFNDPHEGGDISIISSPGNGSFIIMRRATIRLANIEKLGKPPIRFAGVEAM